MATGIRSPEERASMRASLANLRDSFTDPTATATQGPTVVTAATTTTSSGLDATKTSDPAAQTVPSAGGPSVAVASDPLGNSSAATAFVPAHQTASPASTDSDGAQGLQGPASRSGGMSSGTRVGIGVGVGIGVAVLLALIALFFIIRRRRKRRYEVEGGVEQMRGQSAMTSTEPALAGASALGRSQSYRSNNRSSYHSLSPIGPPTLPETAMDPMPEANKGIISAQPTIVPPSQQALSHEPHEAQTPRSRRSMEAELIRSPEDESLATPAPPYDDAPSPVDERLSRPVSPVSSVSSMGSRPPSLRRSFDS